MQPLPALPVHDQARQARILASGTAALALQQRHHIFRQVFTRQQRPVQPCSESAQHVQADPDGNPVRYHPALLARSQVQDHLDTQTGTIFLGLDPGGSAVFAASIRPAARDAVAAATQVRYATAG